MKNTDKILDQLFAQSRRAPSPAAGESELSKGLENRILADWRRGPREESINLVPVFRWGFGFALAASVLIIATSTMTAQTNEFFNPTVQVSTYSGPIIP